MVLLNASTKVIYVSVFQYSAVGMVVFPAEDVAKGLFGVLLQAMTLGGPGFSSIYQRWQDISQN